MRLHDDVYVFPYVQHIFLRQWQNISVWKSADSPRFSDLTVVVSGFKLAAKIAAS